MIIQSIPVDPEMCRKFGPTAALVLGIIETGARYAPGGCIPFDNKEIAKALGLNPATVRAAIRQLANAKAIELYHYHSNGQHIAKALRYTGAKL